MGAYIWEVVVVMPIFMNVYTSVGGYYPNFTVTYNNKQAVCHTFLASAHSHVQLSFWYSTVLQQKSTGLGMQLPKCNQ